MKNEEKTALSERVQQSFQRLSSTAANLNQVSDKLNASVAGLENSLRKLGLGIGGWVRISGSNNNDGSYWYEDVGYAKVNGKWGFAIKSGSGHEAADFDKTEVWAFNDAPRDLRIAAIKKIPDLIEKLNAEAALMASNVAEKIEDVDLLASAIGELSSAKTEGKKK